MHTNPDPHTGFKAELKIIPTWAYIVAAVGFIAAHIYFLVFMSREPEPLSPWILEGLAILSGIIVGCYFLVIGYISRDARRRGMSPLLWTLVALLIPNSLGILLYFILRQRLTEPFTATFAATATATSTPTNHNHCPRCGFQLTAACPQCQRLVAPDDTFCKHCGTSLHSQPTPSA